MALEKILGNGSIMWSEEQNGSCLVVETVKISNASFNFLSGLCKAVRIPLGYLKAV